jgi:hypothetical protein
MFISLLEWAAHERCVGEMINMSKMLVGNPEGKRQGRGREDNIKVDVKL